MLDVPGWLRWCVWGTYVALWSLALLTPYPADVNEHLLPSAWQEPAAKALHICAYAVLAALSGWLELSRPLRCVLLVVLSLHACGTEFGQLFVPHRHGSFSDIGFDHIGLFWGILLSFSLWSRSPAHDELTRIQVPASVAERNS